MIRVCRENGTKLGVIFQMRFGSVGAKVDEARRLGRDGQDTSRRRHRQILTDGCVLRHRGVERDMGARGRRVPDDAVDPYRRPTPMDRGAVKSVTGRVATKRHAIQVEDTAAALVSFENGAMGVIESTTSVRPALKSRLEIHGENGSVVANAQYDKILLWDVKTISGRRRATLASHRHRRSLGVPTDASSRSTSGHDRRRS